MSDTDELAALDSEIQMVEANMRDLTEAAAAASGAANEENIARRLEEQQETLDELHRRRKALGGE